MPFRITTTNVLQFTWRRSTVDSAKEKLKGKFLKNIEYELFTRGQVAAHLNSYRWLNRRQTENNVFLFWLCYKRNGKRCSCATVQPWSYGVNCVATACSVYSDWTEQNISNTTRHIDNKNSVRLASCRLNLVKSYIAASEMYHDTRRQN